MAIKKKHNNKSMTQVSKGYEKFIEGKEIIKENTKEFEKIITKTLLNTKPLKK